ncbi:MAG: VTT domain-containing protein [Clostridiales bacterium]|jgi:uncharacterized membrane protein YdjX (TVP38/TMEM64 family)|nr:VTT domain-containing protein [Clostridiales bacterium]
MKKNKANIIIVLICAVFTIVGGILLTRSLAVTGWIIAGVGGVLLLVFYFLVKKNNEPLIKLMLSLFLLGVVIIAIMLVLSYMGILEYIKEVDQNDLAEMVKNSDSSKLVYMLIQFLQVTFLPIPSNISTAAGALIFSPWDTIWYTFVGVMIGSLLAFIIGRLFGVRVARWIVGQEMLDKYYNYVKGKDKVLLFLMFLLPMFPDDILCMISGLTNMKFRTFVLMMCISRPIQIISTVFGAIALKSIPIPFKGWGILFWVGIGAATIALIILLLKFGPRLEKRMLKVLEKLNKIKAAIFGKITRTALYQKFDAKRTVIVEKFKRTRLYKRAHKHKQDILNKLQGPEENQPEENQDENREEL